MAKTCPVTGDIVLYLDCLECEDKECKNIYSNKESSDEKTMSCSVGGFAKGISEDRK